MATLPQQQRRNAGHALPILAATLLSLSACDTRAVVTHAEEGYAVPQTKFSDVTPPQWVALGTKRFLFGHQSVGGNILDGVADVIARHPAIALRVVEAKSLDSARAPGLYHAKIGVNGDPASKTAAFTSLTGTGAPDVAMMKFCYLDVDGRTDPDALFAAYARQMSELRSRHPGLVIVHVTMPLADNGNWKERLVNTVKGRPTARELNRLRNRYNALLRAAYAGKEPVFDLARLESTRADGSRTFFLHHDEPVYTLAPELTDDGGHLNAVGRRIAAEHFLALLAAL